MSFITIIKGGRKNKWICFFFLFLSFLSADLKESSAPYVSGDTFRSFADFIFDETQSSFDPKKVCKGDVIFVKGNLLKKFFKKKHPFIKKPYVLICHNSDKSMPGNFSSYLKSDKIICWFAQNADYKYDPKLIPIPIGVANQCWPHGKIEVIDEIKTEEIKKEHLLYLNVRVETFLKEREFVVSLLKDQPFCFNPESKPFKEYLEDLAASKFVVSPRGNGLDCHRTWEALYLGAIPIVKSSNLDRLYDGLPVLIVNDWEEITERFLEEKYHEMRLQTYNFEKLDAEYWYHEVRKFKG